MRFISYRTRGDELTIGDRVWINPYEVSSIMETDGGTCMIMMKAGDSYMVNHSASSVKSDIETVCEE